MTRDLFNEPLRRRELLQGSAGLALALGLAGCGVGEEPASKAEKSAPPKKIAAKPDGDLVYFNWSEYLDPKLIKEFEKRYGVKVRESNFDSMNAMMAKLRSGNKYDVIFPTADWAQRLTAAGQLLRFDKAQLKNSETVYDYFAKPWYDPGADHTIPYALYASGILYRKDKVEMTGSWNDLGLDSAKGKIYMLDDYQEVLGAGAMATGSDLNTKDQAEVDKAKEWALDLKPNLRGYSTDDIQNMVGGNAWIHHGWNGDVVNVRNQVKNPDNFSFQKCTEGIPLGTDCMSIPANAEHPGTALTFINFILEPENAARNIEYMGYPMPYTGPDEAFAELVKTDPSINVTIEDLENGDQFRDLGADGRRMWDDAWTEIKAA